MNQLFGTMIFVQYFATIIDTCTIIYELSRLSVRDEYFWSFASVFASIIGQIFIYCYSGEKIMNKVIRQLLNSNLLYSPKYQSTGVLIRAMVIQIEKIQKSFVHIHSIALYSKYNIIRMKSTAVFLETMSSLACGNILLKLRFRKIDHTHFTTKDNIIER